MKEQNLANVTFEKVISEMEKELRKKSKKEIKKTNFSILFNQCFKEVLRKENVLED